MEKVIERLEEVESFLFERYRFGLSEGVDNKPLIKRIDILKDAIAELKAPPIRKGEGERRVRCNWCGSVFDEEHIKVRDDIEYCPVCGDSGYLMDLSEAESKPRWETPEQREKRTGEKWPDNAAVYYRLAYSHTTYEGVYYDEFSGEWYANLYRYISAYDKELRKTLSGKHQIICATEAGPPPDDWRPEEGK